MAYRQLLPYKSFLCNTTHKHLLPITTIHSKISLKHKQYTQSKYSLNKGKSNPYTLRFPNTVLSHTQSLHNTSCQNYILQYYKPLDRPHRTSLPNCSQTRNKAHTHLIEARNRPDKFKCKNIRINKSLQYKTYRL